MIATKHYTKNKTINLINHKSKYSMAFHNTNFPRCLHEKVF